MIGVSERALIKRVAPKRSKMCKNKIYSYMLERKFMSDLDHTFSEESCEPLVCREV